MPATLSGGQNAVEVQIQRSSVLSIAVRVLRRFPRLCAGRANVRFSKIGSLGPRVQLVLMWFSAVHCGGHDFRGGYVNEAWSISRTNPVVHHLGALHKMNAIR